MEAAPHFLAGALDPRILVSYFPELSRPLFTDGEEADVYDGISKRMPSEANVDDLSEYSKFYQCPSPSFSAMRNYLFPTPLHPTHLPLSPSRRN